MVEENLWRAIRHGLDGRMIDFTRGEEVPTRGAVERLIEWTEPARRSLGLEVALPEQNGAQRAYARYGFAPYEGEMEKAIGVPSPSGRGLG